MTNNILTKQGYFSEYYSLYTEEKYQYQIWMKLESRLMEKYGVQRYETIEAFTAIFKSSVATYASVPENFIFVPSFIFCLSTSLSDQNKPS